MTNTFLRSSVFIALLFLSSTPGFAQSALSDEAGANPEQPGAPTHLILPGPSAFALDHTLVANTADGQGDSQPVHAAAFEYSPAYETRAKIHKYASFATLPLFATEVVLGQSLYNGSNTGSMRGVHAAVGAGIVGLFGVNTVTGAWNLFGEGWKDPNNKKLRVLHGLLMMAADAGFLATEAYGPHGQSLRGALTYQSDKVIHRNLAFASISVGTAGYLTMLLGSR